MVIGYLKVMKKLTYWESKIIRLNINFYRGGCAIVWLGKNLKTGEMVALK
jgi:hypothetical protein